jgi:hypothetical protein
MELSQWNTLVLLMWPNNTIHKVNSTDYQNKISNWI